MKITVEFLSLPNVVKIVGGKSLALDFRGETIDDLVKAIVDKYGQKLRRFLLDESGKLDMMFNVLLNKKEWIRGNQMNKILEDGDQVTIMILAAGG